MTQTPDNTEDKWNVFPARGFSMMLINAKTPKKQEEHFCSYFYGVAFFFFAEIKTSP